MRKTYKLLLLLAIAATALPAAAYDFMVDGICYNINSDDNSVTVTYENSSSPRYTNASGSLSIPSSVTYNGNTYRVTSIGKDAFSDCRGFTGTLIIPNSVTTIGTSAFSGCSGFTGSLTIPNSVTTIGVGAFYGCSGITSVHLPNTITKIENYAFENCPNLYRINIPKNVVYIGTFAFGRDIGYGSQSAYHHLYLNGDCEIGYKAFFYNLGNSSANSCSIYSITIGRDVTEIGNLEMHPSYIYCLNTTPPICNSNTFSTDYTYFAELHVPRRALAAYIEAPYWSNFSKIIGDAIAPEDIVFDETPIALDLGEQITLSSTLLPSNTNIDAPIQWFSTDSRIASVNDGVVNALKAGECDIIVSCLDIERCCHVTVTEDAITITLDKHEVELEAGTIVTLTPSSAPVPVEFAVQSSDPTVAVARMLNGKVQVVGAKPGMAVITVSDVEGKATPDTCRVTVVRPVGDATGDGYLDIDDVNTMINVMLDMVPRPEGEELTFYDFDGNRKVDIDDLNQLINILLAQ